MKNDIENPKSSAETNIKELESFLTDEELDRLAKLRELYDLQARTLGERFAGDEDRKNTQAEILSLYEEARKKKAEKEKHK